MFWSLKLTAKSFINVFCKAPISPPSIWCALQFFNILFTVLLIGQRPSPPLTHLATTNTITGKIQQTTVGQILQTTKILLYRPRLGKRHGRPDQTRDITFKLHHLRVVHCVRHPSTPEPVLATAAIRVSPTVISQAHKFICEHGQINYQMRIKLRGHVANWNH